MADGITVEVDSVAFEAAMQRLRQGVRDGFIDPTYGILSKQASLLSKRCQDFTPPRNAGQGRVAVTRDLSTIFRPLSQATFEDRGIRKIIRDDNRSAWDAAARNFGNSHNLKNTRAIGFTDEWHKKNRLSRWRGRAGKGGNIGVVTLGAEAKAARSYIRTIKDRVGWARAGWNMGIMAFGGFVEASWISKHSVTRGRIVDGRNTPDPFVQVINDTGWAKYRNNEGMRILRNAINARARDMEAYALKMMQIAKERALGGLAA